MNIQPELFYPYDFLEYILLILYIFPLIIFLILYHQKKTLIRLIFIYLLLMMILNFFVFNIFILLDLWVWFIPIEFITFAIFLFFVALHINRMHRTIDIKSKALTKSEDKFKYLVNNVLDIIIELNLNGDILYASPQIYTFLQYSSTDAFNSNLFNIIHSLDKKYMKLSLQEAFTTNQDLKNEFRLKKKSGDYVNVSLNAKIMETNDNFKLIGVIRDITKQKEVEELNLKQIQKLKEIDDIRRDLIRRISHELKTPLIQIFSSSQHLLKDFKEDISEDVYKIIEIINRGGNRLNNLTENLLDVFYLESKGLKLNKEKIDIVKVIENCANDLILLLENKDLILKMKLNGSLFLEIDKMRIEQVIFNLLTNAIKNTPPKGIIYITLIKQQEYIDIIIRDTGVGLLREEIGKIFKKFGKVERLINDKGIEIEGSGLGLFISKEIVELHNGKIWVESEGRNKGSKFITRLPLNL